MPLKKPTIDHILTIEGGYVHDPSDSAGETHWWITRRVARRNGYAGAMRDMPRQIAFDLYATRYWDELCLNEIEKLCPTVAAELADTGVNMGVVRAACLQHGVDYQAITPLGGLL